MGCSIEDGFERMHDAGLKRNIRTVIINRPEYAGSTKYTDEQIREAAEGQKVFLDRFQLQLAHFLQFMVSELRVPRFNKSQKIGGIAIMGWSLGVLYQLSLLADPAVIPRDVYNAIEPEITNMIIYGKIQNKHIYGSLYKILLQTRRFYRSDILFLKPSTRSTYGSKKGKLGLKCTRTSSHGSRLITITRIPTRRRLMISISG
jgi:hypothetical protein